MKKVILSLIAMLFVSTATFAQQESDRGQRPRFNREEMIKQRTEMMVKKYGLNEEQAAALQALNEKSMPQMRGPRPGQRPEGQRGEKRERRHEPNDSTQMKQRRERGDRQGGPNFEAYNEELQKIMTAEQFKAYTEDMQKMREQGPRRRQ